MEDYSLFSSSTNSESSSSCANYFPFSLDHTGDNSYDFGLDNHDHHDILNPQILEIPTIQSPLILDDDSYHNNYDTNNDHRVKYHPDQDDDVAYKKEITIMNDDGSKLAKKVSSSSKKIKKHRYAFQTRSQVDILDDGYRWRKYGQKAVKNNTFPRFVTFFFFFFLFFFQTKKRGKLKLGAFSSPST